MYLGSEILTMVGLVSNRGSFREVQVLKKCCRSAAEVL